jgi:hypothetical protein
MVISNCGRNDADSTSRSSIVATVAALVLTKCCSHYPNLVQPRSFTLLSMRMRAYASQYQALD